jgi:hypothetical protein
MGEISEMVVTVVDREAMRKLWGTPGLFKVITKTVEIGDKCPVCGGLRGTPVKRPFCEDEDFYSVDCWVNPCGHIDYYPNVLEEADIISRSQARCRFL